jgi:hypothetical protein
MLPKPDLVQPEPISQLDLLQGIMQGLGLRQAFVPGDDGE